MVDYLFPDMFTSKDRMTHFISEYHYELLKHFKKLKQGLINITYPA